MKDFPDNFLWGVASSSFQIEGGIENDFTVWEKKGRFNQNGKNPKYGKATDHWNRWQEDFDLLKKYNVNAYRFSIEWARIEPEQGKFDESAIDQYRRMIDRLLELNIIPMLTLHHFSHPEWFHKISPWHKANSVDSFLDYITKITDLFADKIDHLITFNEPVVWVLAAYGEGVFPPGKKDNDKMMVALYNILRAHKETYTFIKSRNPKINIGIAKHIISFAANNLLSPFDRVLTLFLDNFFNKMLPDAFQKNSLEIRLPLIINFEEKLENLNESIDFWGINYYYRMFVRLRFNVERPFDLLLKDKRGLGVSDLGWEIYPEGLLSAVKSMALYGKPLYITENGIAAVNDKLRIRFLREHLSVLKQAIAQKHLLKGYFHWSLLDNYEWLEGTDARFGLVNVDFEGDYSRLEKESLFYYSDFIKNSKKRR